MKNKQSLTTVITLGLVIASAALLPVAQPAPIHVGGTSRPVTVATNPLGVGLPRSLGTLASVTNNTPSLVSFAEAVTSTTSTTYASDLPSTISNEQMIIADGVSYPLRHYEASSLPNDPGANQPWVAGANLSSAWDIPRGNSPTILAIIDTGVALKHQEFTNRWYTNAGESGSTSQQNPSIYNCSDRSLPINKSCNLIDDDGDGTVDNEIGTTTSQNPSLLNCSQQGLSLDKSCNLIDDDANGYIDDVRGWDFANNDRSVQAGQVNPRGAGTHHATYVTGVAAATGNDGVGIAGVDWGTTILPIQALDDNGSGNTSTVANAINYAVSQKANVISLSLGSTYDDPYVHLAIDRAIAAGVTVVAAAGNNGCDCMSYPANYPEVISVGAADSNGNPASFSSFGSNLKLLAPGVNLYTSDWQAGNPTSAYASGISGTSLATPIVSGLITRLLSQQPTATPAQLLAALLENTNRSGVSAGQSRSNSYGFGLIDASKASLRMINSYSPTQMYSFSGAGTTPTYQCENGATAIYEINPGGGAYFTSSILQQSAASSQGNASNIFTYACVLQPHDTPASNRAINLLSEFRNFTSKY